MKYITLNDKLKDEFHPTKNGNLTADYNKFLGNNKLWWLCPNTCVEGCNHEWEALLSNRTYCNSGCPYCASNPTKTCKHTSLLNINPKLANEWHPSKNGDLLVNNFTPGSSQKVWWLCDKSCPQGCKHEWQATICDRNKGGGCPYCQSKRNLCIHTSIMTTHPTIAKEWHPTKNDDLLPELFTSGSKQKIWWICSNLCPEGCSHEWQSTIGDRVAGYNCPYCARKQPCIHTSLLISHPHISKEWHPTKNGDLKPSDVLSGSHKYVWWLCPNTCPEGCAHEWQAIIKSRTMISVGCIYCSKRTCCSHTSFLTTHPELAKLWHPIKNNITPDMISYGSGIKIWWQCIKNNNHEWQTKVCSISTGTSCPICKNKTEEKLFNYLKHLYNNTIHTYKVEWCVSNSTNKFYPYDFFIPELNIIIELDGNQHFKQISNWNSPEDTINRDIYKMKMAIENNVSLIRILQEDVYKNNNSWLDKNLLSELIKYETPTIVFITKDNDNIYDNHIERLNIELQI